MFDMATDGAPAALIAEPVISAGGVIVPPEGYFGALKQACGDRGMLLVFDEAQTAFGRIGDRFAATARRCRIMAAPRRSAAVCRWPHHHRGAGGGAQGRFTHYTSHALTRCRPRSAFAVLRRSSRRS
jgi:hypothetical protein